jgi:hypothetical protein
MRNSKHRFVTQTGHMGVDLTPEIGWAITPRSPTPDEQPPGPKARLRQLDRAVPLPLAAHRDGRNESWILTAGTTSG